MPPVAVIGLSHRTATVDIRGRLAAVKPLLDAALRNHTYQAVRESVVLSTCNRLEIYVVGDNSSAAATEIAAAAEDFEKEESLREQLISERKKLQAELAERKERVRNAPLK